jgi:simple sugar transport system ATP-binding protein
MLVVFLPWRSIMENLIRIENLTKTFGNVKALNDVSIDIKKGEIHGLIGANGSGKSTLMNILFGHPKIAETGGYSGNIYLDSEIMDIKRCEEAMKLGLGMIHQEFALMEEMSVAENIMISKEKTKFGHFLKRDIRFIDSKANKAEAKKILEMLDINLNPGTKVKYLSTSMKQFVEIAREISQHELKLLVLDEPSAVLNREDSERLLDIIKKLNSQGVTIIFISHRLEEIKSISDRVTILRNGNHIGTYDSVDLSLEKMAEEMMGREIVKTHKSTNLEDREIIMEFKNFGVSMPGELMKDMNLSVKKGEILGVISLSGHGKLAIGHGIFGRYETSGEVYYKGRKLDLKNPAKSIEDGLYFLSDDRKNHGLLMDESIKKNINFTAYMAKNKGVMKKSILKTADDDVEVKVALDYLKKFDIKCEDIYQNVSELSGGNQQKVCLARSFYLEPELLIVAEPTRGIDIAAKEKILEFLVEMNESKNSTLIIVSSELTELKRVCDRIAVLSEGRLVDVLDSDEDEKNFGFALSGEWKRGDL